MAADYGDPRRQPEAALVTHATKGVAAFRLEFGPVTRPGVDAVSIPGISRYQR
jgi:hypothetical protein